MRQAIETKYLGATDYRPSRIVARTEGGHRLVVSYRHEYDAPQNHRMVAMELAANLGWYEMGSWHGGATVAGYAFVLEVTP